MGPLSTTFTLDRYENQNLLGQLDEHRLRCRTCQEATRVERACYRARKLHESIVRGAQMRYTVRKASPGVGTQAAPWYQTIELADLPNEKSATEFLRETAEKRKLDTLQGIDVSLWQGVFPWDEAVAQGMSLALAKASEGRGYTDSQWGANVAALLAPGPIVGGSYHFLHDDGVGEASWYLSRHPAACFSTTQPWVFACDAEAGDGSAEACYAFLSTVSSKIGYSCWFYSYPNWISTRGVQAYGNPLWIAYPNPGAPPNMGWPAITMHQYGTRGFSVGQVDANTFEGDLRTLYVLGGVGAAPAPDPGPPPPPPILQGAQDMSLAVAPHPNGVRVDLVVVGVDRKTYHCNGAVGWDASSYSPWEVLSGPDTRAVSASWLNPANPGLVVWRTQDDGSIQVLNWSAQNGWSTQAQVAGLVSRGAWVEEAGPKGDKGDKGDPGASTADVIAAVVAKLQS